MLVVCDEIFFFLRQRVRVDRPLLVPNLLHPTASMLLRMFVALDFDGLDDLGGSKVGDREPSQSQQSNLSIPSPASLKSYHQLSQRWARSQPSFCHPASTLSSVRGAFSTSGPLLLHRDKPAIPRHLSKHNDFSDLSSLSEPRERSQSAARGAYRRHRTRLVLFPSLIARRRAALPSS